MPLLPPIPESLTKREQIISYFMIHDKKEVTSKIYKWVFPHDVEHTEYSLQMFRDRVQAQLYAFPERGLVSGGAGSPTTVQAAKDGPAPLKRPPPVEGKSVGSAILRLNGFGMVTAAGKLWTADYGMGAPGLPAYVNMQNEKVRRWVGEDFSSHARTQAQEECSAELLKAVAEYYRGDPVFVNYVGSCLALDDSGRLWFQVTGAESYIPLLLSLGPLDGDASNLITGKVIQLRGESGWFQIFAVEGRGLFYWKDIKWYPESNQARREPKLYCVAEAYRLPGVYEGVIDCAYGILVDQRAMFIIKKDNTVVWSVGEGSGRFAEFQLEGLEKLNDLPRDRLGEFIQMVSTPRKLTLLTENGCIVVVKFSKHAQRIKHLSVITTLQGKNVMKIAVEEYHGLALTEEGEVYLWDEMRNPDISPYRLFSEPTLLTLPGRAYDIDAGTGISGVLACPHPEAEAEKEEEPVGIEMPSDASEVKPEPRNHHHHHLRHLRRRENALPAPKEEKFFEKLGVLVRDTRNGRAHHHHHHPHPHEAPQDDDEDPHRHHHHHHIHVKRTIAKPGDSSGGARLEAYYEH